MPGVQELEQWFGQVEDHAADMVGGRARMKVVVLMACVLGLTSADFATIGAIAGQLKSAFNITNVQIGLLVTATTGIGALATLPMGVLVDRVHRTRILSIGIVFWGITMLVSSASNSYIMLLLTRIGLGAVVAIAAPAVASLTGDYFRPGARGRIWGYILSGELFGAAFGIVVAGMAAAIFSWRASFWVLAAVSLILAPMIWQWLPEPARGTQNYLTRGKEEIPSTEELQENNSEKQKNKNSGRHDKVEEEVEESSIEPVESNVLEENPATMPFWDAVRYILSIRTNVLLIVASACGYFFFAGIRTFAVIFLRARFDLSQGTGKLLVVVLGLGAIAGVFITGYAADRLIKREHISARITVAGIAFLLTVVFFLSGFLSTSIYISMVLFFIAAAALGGTNPPLDAARLDIMHSRLWGRAEGVRTTLRYSFVAVAPIAFGMVFSALGTKTGSFGVGIQGIKNALPLAHTFMIMLVPVLIAAILLLVLPWRYNPYPRDVATALASEEATRDEE